MRTKIKIVIIALIGMSLGVRAQEWNPNGDNTTTGGVRANYFGVENLIICYGNENSNWSKSNHLKDRTFFYTGSQSKGMFFSSYGKDASIRFQTGNTWGDKPEASLILGNNGNVGIGTTNPTAKLSVNGKIHTREVRVDLNLSDWSDFVFEKDYSLATLQEVENHIKEKGHLKDIPSAKEVEENGIFLGEMDSKLLQKIEELTLYTIQQEKKINRQSSKLKKQEQEIAELKSLNKILLELQKRLEKLENK